ncbi:hypothetical protein KQUDLBSD_CDS0154 [Staphylococcus phage PG-2021_40]|nr:hypothetical protein [Mammaliicoccus phage vB_MscM-PMS3]WBF82228.1 hypothetical protein [Mammaliicoccus virus vB_MscM-PMS2]
MYNKFIELSLFNYSQRDINNVDIRFTPSRYDKIDFDLVLKNTGYSHSIKEQSKDSIIVSFIKKIGEQD